MNLLPVAQYLESQGLGIVAKDIFVDAFPADVEAGLMLRPRLTGMRIDASLPGYLRGHFQVIARAPSYEAAESLANRAAQALRWKKEETLGPWLVKTMMPETVPFGFPVGDADLREFTFNVMLRVVDDRWA